MSKIKIEDFNSDNSPEKAEESTPTNFEDHFTTPGKCIQCGSEKDLSERNECYSCSCTCDECEKDIWSKDALVYKKAAFCNEECQEIFIEKALDLNTCIRCGDVACMADTLSKNDEHFCSKSCFIALRFLGK